MTLCLHVPVGEHQEYNLNLKNLSHLHRKLSVALAACLSGCFFLFIVALIEVFRTRVVNGVVLMSGLGTLILIMWSYPLHTKWKRAHCLLGIGMPLDAGEHAELSDIEAICPAAAMLSVRRAGRVAHKQDLWLARKALNDWLAA